jgi:hypothetical protein
MKKKKSLFIIIILVTALLIGLVIWIYAKRIKNIESKMQTSAIGARDHWHTYKIDNYKIGNVSKIDTYKIDNIRKYYRSPKVKIHFLR